ncbi:MAG TPA: tRNA uridine-5-carboxymethylaminomethyl(34) synthesis enzyme MnmG, partial [Thermopetrobacter sp.]|nr:tRNA uridine-5-carboxymethylaminomethyl(34) synthesis enzyme MnmG [Thermopetrobacter sp.]
AGQINGTTGYEEAAAQGLLAGLNAARLAGDLSPITISRTDGYLGVMIDDLITRGVTEPYRMFTSRAEYRLMLRADNADERLTPLGIAAGIVGEERRAAFGEKMKRLKAARAFARAHTITPQEAARFGIAINHDGRRRDVIDLLSLPGVTLADVRRIWPRLEAFDEAVLAQLETEAVYAGFLDRQRADMERFRKEERVRIPGDYSYDLPGLSNELKEKLRSTRPATLAQAARIDGMTPAALTLILAHLKKAAERKAG